MPNWLGNQYAVERAMSEGFDYDWLVIGSGFGGSVSALRLTEKGYRVGVLECGRRFADHEFPESTSDYKRYFWRPKIGWKGIFRLTTFKDVSVVSGCGVGGGSLGYANTLYVPPKPFFEDPQWAGIADWETELAPHYEEAQRMLGVTTNPYDDPADALLRELGEELGVSDTYKKTPVGVYFGEVGASGAAADDGGDAANAAVRDPYFGGEGPDRTPCSLCGRCMVGCPHGSKNTLVKNYLYLAEKRGAKVSPERTVIDIRPLGAGDGSDGYEVESIRSGAWVRRERQLHRARGVVVSAGPLGTNTLLQRCRLGGSLPRISSRLGELVRTNSEAILAVTVPEDYPENLIKRVAITSSIYPDPHTHIETVTYGNDGDSMSRLYTLLTGDGTRVTRPLKLLGQIARHPRRFAQVLRPKNWSKRTIIILVMQTLDNAMALRPKQGPFKTLWLSTEQDPERPNPTFIPVANQAAEWFAKRTGGVAQSSVMEAMLNIPTTAHILGGAVIGSDAERGVVDAHQCVFGYENLLVCDGSAIPANVGVNPSLTITALAEHAISHVPAVRSDAPATGSGAVAEDPDVLAAH
jgi:cholesterol oxidase